MKPLHIIFKSSKILSLLLGLVAVTVNVILILLPMLWQIKLLLTTAVISASVYAICLHGLRILPWSLVALNINSGNELRLIRRDGWQLPKLQLSGDSVALPYLTVMRCKPAEAAGLLSYYLLLLPDAVEPDRFRQLRVWLRWGAGLHKSGKNH